MPTTMKSVGIGAGKLIRFRQVLNYSQCLPLHIDERIIIGRYFTNFQ